ncbi:MAG: KGK domain-containing protein [Cyanobacteria bacterium P01_H01_bin.35]
MTNTFQTLECDTDILMIGKDTFTIERFKELVVEKIRTSFHERPIVHRANRSFNQDIEGPSVFDVLGRMNNVKIVDNSSVKLDLKNIELISPTEGIECKILKLGNSEWQTGKLIINVMFRNNLDVGSVKL